MTTTLKPSIRHTLAALALGAATLTSAAAFAQAAPCLLYTSPSPRDS